MGAPVLNGSAPCTYLRQVERSGGVAGVRPATGLVGVHGVWLARGVLWPEAVDAEVRRPGSSRWHLCLCCSKSRATVQASNSSQNSVCILHIQLSITICWTWWQWQSTGDCSYLLNVVEEIKIGCRGGDDERKQENGDGEGAVVDHALALLMFRCSVALRLALSLWFGSSGVGLLPGWLFDTGFIGSARARDMSLAHGWQFF